ncbi:TetR/AcrR family transcriptional regulator [Jonesia denitrificans]|uniref:Transcriptional regulator, TetR family n=1 Tax=Jonesia denitrificans (strain ATCC 14870 / DSM 20603 / BCRC 15368 / CIP 55.134 / JCM 11481 / NBRC 15587 / NCTC 10816 / Prevot 55134) TaxID=471856 RepID=C7R2M0_JONDD|nr:TetR/AcrR family transcriptional regulator [Jonesia denitrificans]ACV10011.1 transcriptional regulator, TetR family [Jonesia denitrificans DSM 20603]ASE08756.1 TetR/AcrR family transcriptional regulator [Jonesia denitrificans]QXB43360.1 TetR/AcrR family transcriptional regulator [Jonesia denitrificans]SQH22793.1 transcriptional regulator BetI [Jonesia denitrificans]
MRSITEKTADDGRSTRWDEHRATRRRDLARAARKAVHIHGTDISMDDIATHAGTSKSIMYRYFTDKTGLQQAVSEEVMQQIREALETAAHTATSPRDALRNMVSAYLEMIEHSPNVYYFVTRDAPGLPFLDLMIDLLATPFAQEMNAPDTDARAWGAGAVGFVRGTGEWWLHHLGNPGIPTRTELTDRITAWLWNGPIATLVRHRTHEPPP